MINKLPVSVIIIARNEAAVLQRCLDSVKLWAGEIVAVINDCSDNTQEVLLANGAQVYEHDWQGFVVQKNRAISYAKFSWIFSIDADEMVTPKAYREIYQIINQEDPKIAGVSFKRKTWLLDRWIKHGDWYPDRVIRLFRRELASFKGDFLHERLEVKGKILYSQANLLHYSFPTMYLFLTKNETFTRYFITANLGKKKFSYAGTIIRTFWKFFRGYFIKRGFLDGYPGFIIALQQAYSTFFRYNMLLEHQVKNTPCLMDKEDE